jgi:hypothetical protein
MTQAPPPEGYEPVPGESRLLLVSCAVLLGFGAVATIVALVASTSVPNLETTVLGAVSILVVSALGFLYALWQRRDYLRKVRSGEVIERRPWRGENLMP